MVVKTLLSVLILHLSVCMRVCVFSWGWGRGGEGGGGVQQGKWLQVFTLCQEPLSLPCVQTFRNRLVQTCDHERYFWTLHSEAIVIDTGFHSGSQGRKSTNHSAPIISQIFQGNLVHIETCWCDEHVTYFILSYQYSGREPSEGDFIETKQNCDFGLHSGIYRSISFRLGMMTDRTSLLVVVWYQFELPWPSFKVTRQTALN